MTTSISALPWPGGGIGPGDAPAGGNRAPTWPWRSGSAAWRPRRRRTRRGRTGARQGTHLAQQRQLRGARCAWEQGRPRSSEPRPVAATQQADGDPAGSPASRHAVAPPPQRVPATMYCAMKAIATTSPATKPAAGCACAGAGERDHRDRQQQQAHQHGGHLQVARSRCPARGRGPTIRSIAGRSAPAAAAAAGGVFRAAGEAPQQRRR